MDVRLADVVEVRTGYSFRGKIDEDPAGRLAVVQMKDVGDIGHLKPEDCIRITEGPAHRRHLLQPGDVLVQARGSTFPAVMVEAPFHGIAAFGLHVLHPADKVLPEFLVWALNHPVLQAAMSGMAKGSSVPFLSKSNLADLQVPISTLETQRRVVGAAKLAREAAALADEVQTLRNQYVAAATWRAATHS